MAQIDNLSRTIGAVEEKVNNINNNIVELKKDFSELRKENSNLGSEMRKRVSRIEKDQTKMNVWIGLISGGVTVFLFSIIKKFTNF